MRWIRAAQVHYFLQPYVLPLNFYRSFVRNKQATINGLRFPLPQRPRKPANYTVLLTNLWLRLAYSGDVPRRRLLGSLDPRHYPIPIYKIIISSMPMGLLPTIYRRLPNGPAYLRSCIPQFRHCGMATHLFEY